MTRLVRQANPAPPAWLAAVPRLSGRKPRRITPESTAHAALPGAGFLNRE